MSLPYRSTPRLGLFCAAALLAAVALGVLTGCGVAAEVRSEADEAAIEAAVHKYLPLLSDAYSTGNLKALREVAVPKEVARVQFRLEELEEQGRRFEPQFKYLVVEGISTWKHSNAFVTTVEVWDVRSYTLGSHTLQSEVIGQSNRVKYQLKLKDEGWMVLYRELDQTLD
jgi:hypothetical protein